MGMAYLEFWKQCDAPNLSTHHRIRTVYHPYHSGKNIFVHWYIFGMWARRSSEDCVVEKCLGSGH